MSDFLKRFYHRSKPQFRWLWPWIIRGRDFLRWLPIQKVPISSKYFGRPKGFYRTTQEFIESHAGRLGQNTCRQIYPAETLRFTLPIPLDGGEVHPNFRENQVKEMPPSYVFELENARFWGHYGGSVISSNDRLLGDLSHDVLGVERHKIFTKFKLPKCKRLAGTVAVLATAEAATNYWHWTFDLLPRFHLLQKGGFTPENVDFYLVNHTNLPFQLQTLAELGIRPEQIIQTNDYLHVETQRLAVPSLKPSQFHVAPWACEFLRGFAHDLDSKVPPNRRLFVTRQNATFRHLLNEGEVWTALSEHGFEKVCCEALSVTAQRQRFSEAEIVVAPHGSGLTNLAYCPPGTAVIEIFAPNYVDVAFWTHASQSKLRHFYLLGHNSANHPSSHKMARTADMIAPVDSLVSKVTWLLENLPTRNLSTHPPLSSPAC